MYHRIFIHSSANGRVGCFHVLATVSSTAVNTALHVSFLNYGFLRAYVQEWDLKSVFLTRAKVIF